MAHAHQLPTAAELAETCRAQWPHARFGLTGGALRWVDGPARLEVHAVLAAAGYPRPDLEAAAIDLTRAYSDEVIATAVLIGLDLATRDEGVAAGQGRADGRVPGVERWCLQELDELQCFAIPPGGPPAFGPTPALRISHDEAWDRACRLVEAIGAHPPVRADQPDELRRELRRLGTLATIAGIHRPDRASRDGRGPAPILDEAAAAIRLEVPVPGWPDTGCTATVGSDQPLGAVAPTPRLGWTDGPTPSQLEVAFGGRTPPSLDGCTGYEPERRLSATGIAASVLLYRALHNTPYRDRAAGYHFMARWKVASVRDLERRGRAARDRLAHIQQQLLELPLPLTGPLPPPLERHHWSDGDRLWAAAETLLALTRDRSPDVDRRDHHLGTPADRRIAAEVASTLEDTDTGGLALLLPPEPARQANPTDR